MWIFPLLFFLVMIGMMGFFWRRGFMPGCGMMGDHRMRQHDRFWTAGMQGGEVMKGQYDEMRRNLA